jgi:hypothetical protein
MTPSTRPRVLPANFRAGTQVRRFVGLTLFAATCAIGASWAGIELGRTWGLAEADGGMLEPLWQRVALGGGVAFLGLSFLAGMLVYWRRYIVSLDVEDGGRTVRIDRLAPLPALRLPVDHVQVDGKVHTGHGGDLEMLFPQVRRVNAPWLWVRVRGWRWPLVLDLRGRQAEAGPEAPRTGRTGVSSKSACPSGRGR